MKLTGGQARGPLLQGTGVGNRVVARPRGDVGAGRAAGSITRGLAVLRALVWLLLLMGAWHRLVAPRQHGELARTSVQDDGAVAGCSQ